MEYVDQARITWPSAWGQGHRNKIVCLSIVLMSAFNWNAILFKLLSSVTLFATKKNTTAGKETVVLDMDRQGTEQYTWWNNIIIITNKWSGVS